MSTEDRTPTLPQGRQAITLIEQSGVNRQQLNALYDGHFAALLKAAKEDRLPTLTDFVLQLRKPSQDFRVLAHFDPAVEKKQESARAWLAAKKKGVSVADTQLRALLEEGYMHGGGHAFEVVAVTAAKLGIDPWLFDRYQAGLPHELALKYIYRRAHEHGLYQVSNEELYRICVENKISGTNTLTVATPHAVGSCVNYRHLVYIKRDWYGNRTVVFSHHIVGVDEEILFIRYV